MNKKGQTASINFFDVFLLLLFSVIFFVLFHFSLVLLENNHEVKAAENTGDFSKIFSAITSLRSQLYTGKLSVDTNLQQRIQESELIEGVVITSCFDYPRKDLCEADPLNVGIKQIAKCKWDRNICDEISQEPVIPHGPLK